MRLWAEGAVGTKALRLEQALCVLDWEGARVAGVKCGEEVWPWGGRDPARSQWGVSPWWRVLFNLYSDSLITTWLS